MKIKHIFLTMLFFGLTQSAVKKYITSVKNYFNMNALTNLVNRSLYIITPMINVFKNSVFNPVSSWYKNSGSRDGGNNGGPRDKFFHNKRNTHAGLVAPWIAVLTAASLKNSSDDSASARAASDTVLEKSESINLSNSDKQIVKTAMANFDPEWSKTQKEISKLLSDNQYGYFDTHIDRVAKEHKKFIISYCQKYIDPYITDQKKQEYIKEILLLEIERDALSKKKEHAVVGLSLPSTKTIRPIISIEKFATSLFEKKAKMSNIIENALKYDVKKLQDERDRLKKNYEDEKKVLESIYNSIQRVQSYSRKDNKQKLISNNTNNDSDSLKDLAIKNIDLKELDINNINNVINNTNPDIGFSKQVYNVETQNNNIQSDSDSLKKSSSDNLINNIDSEISVSKKVHTYIGTEYNNTKYFGIYDGGASLGIKELDQNESKKLDQIYSDYDDNSVSKSQYEALSLFLDEIRGWLLNMIENASRQNSMRVSQDKIDAVKNLLKHKIMVDIISHYIFLEKCRAESLPFNAERSKIIMKHSAWACHSVFSRIYGFKEYTIEKFDQDLANMIKRYQEMHQEYNKVKQSHMNLKKS
jgi:hypothetical protein